MTRHLAVREGARLLVLAEGHVLLLADSDPGVPGSGWWVTPGGGRDAGESAAAAAAREAYEETGLRVDAGDVEGPVATRVVLHGYSDRIRVQREAFFRAHVAHFDPEPVAWTDGERGRLKGFRWFPLDGLPEAVWPSDLAELASVDVAAPLDLGVVDESTVPLDEADRERVARHLREVGFFLSP